MRGYSLLALVLGLLASSGLLAERSLYVASSQAVGFVEIRMVAEEAERTAITSRVRFTDTLPEAGDRVTKGVFRLRVAASVAAHREFRYFAILSKDMDESYYVIGLLNEPEVDYGKRFGTEYAMLPVTGVLDTHKIKPLP